ncbi:MAG: MazG nucleotide pyrophosphohydrolase domain-containing protein [Candidatus Micrarchaeota archaeon]
METVAWSSMARLDEYCTVKALRRQIALIDRPAKAGGSFREEHEKSGEMVAGLAREVEELNKTMRTFGVFSRSSRDLKKRIIIMKKIREELGDVFLYSLRVANSLDIDVSKAVHEKIYPELKKIDKPSR